MNENSLDFSQSDFRSLLDKTIEIVLNQYNDLDGRKAYHFHPQTEVEGWFKEPVPLEGMDIAQLLKLATNKVLNTATGNLGPHMYAYVMSGGNQVSSIAELLATTINQNTGKWHLGPSMSELEKRVAEWGANMIGYGERVGGVLVTGGSAANLAGLTVGRNLFFERKNIRKKGLFGLAPMLVYASNEVHGCVDKSLELLGIGTDNLRKIETNTDFTIDLQALEKQIQDDIELGHEPFCIIGNAGTVNTGAIDDLESLGVIAKKYSLWYHIDGAYGGLAASLDSIREKYRGIELADSVAIDFHKWLYQPFEVGCLLVKNWNALRSAYYKRADYLDTSLEQDRGRLDFNEHYFQLSRNAKAFKVWMSFKAYGMNAIKTMIQKDIDLADYLSDEIDKAPDFILKARSDLAISCFQYTGEIKNNEAAIIRINELLIPALEQDGRVFITGTRLNGEFVLRACLINHRKQKHTVDYLIEVIREVGQKLQ